MKCCRTKCPLGARIPALLVQLAAMQLSVAARLADTARESGESAGDNLLGIEDAAKRLGVSEDWLHRRTKKLPFVVRVGRHVRFSAGGIDRYVKNRMGR
jgi:excisionase family DNA binding protein